MAVAEVIPLEFDGQTNPEATEVAAEAERITMVAASIADDTEHLAAQVAAEEADPVTAEDESILEASAQRRAERASKPKGRFARARDLATNPYYMAVAKSQLSRMERREARAAARAAKPLPPETGTAKRIARGVFENPLATIAGVGALASGTYMALRGIDTAGHVLTAAHTTGTPHAHLVAEVSSTKAAPKPVIEVPDGYQTIEHNGKLEVVGPNGRTVIPGIKTDTTGNPTFTDKDLTAMHKKDITVTPGADQPAQAETTAPVGDKDVHVKRVWADGTNAPHFDIRTEKVGGQNKVVLDANTTGTSHGIKNPSEQSYEVHFTDDKGHTVDVALKNDPLHNGHEVAMLDKNTGLGEDVAHHGYKWAEVVENPKAPVNGHETLHVTATATGTGDANFGTKPLELTHAAPERPTLDVAAVKPATTENGHVGRVLLPQGEAGLEMPKSFNLGVDPKTGDLTLIKGNGEQTPILSLPASALMDVKFGPHGQVSPADLHTINTMLKSHNLKVVHDKGDTYALKKLDAATVKKSPSASASPSPSATARSPKPTHSATSTPRPSTSPSSASPSTTPPASPSATPSSILPTVPIHAHNESFDTTLPPIKGHPESIGRVMFHGVSRAAEDMAVGGGLPGVTQVTVGTLLRHNTGITWREAATDTVLSWETAVATIGGAAIGIGADAVSAPVLVAASAASAVVGTAGLRKKNKKPSRRYTPSQNTRPKNRS